MDDLQKHLRILCAHLGVEREVEALPPLPDFNPPKAYAKAEATPEPDPDGSKTREHLLRTKGGYMM